MKILVVGDSCIDEIIYGSVNSLSNNVPVPIFIPEETKQNKGMAGNVYENLKAIVPGTELLSNESVVKKTRFIDKRTHHMFLRVDSEKEKTERIKQIPSKEFIRQYDAVVIVDYDKGFLSLRDICSFISVASMPFVFTKKVIDINDDWTKKPSYIIMSREEVKNSNVKKYNTPYLDDKLVFIKGKDGTDYKKTNYPVPDVETKTRLGVKDSFIASFVYGILNSKDVIKSIKFANNCCTEIVQQKGITTLSKQMIKKYPIGENQ